MPNSKVESILKHGGLAVIPTDTIYGIVARASIRQAVARLYALRRPMRAGKTARKPFIILIGGILQLREFDVQLTPQQKAFLKKVWPGKVSVVLLCPSKKFSYLHLGTNTLAFRLPKSPKLQTLLAKTGPLVAPSANPEGKKPAQTIAEAKKYFGEKVDIYVNADKTYSGKPSTLVSLLEKEPRVLREGGVKIKI